MFKSVKLKNEETGLIDKVTTQNLAKKAAEPTLEDGGFIDGILTQLIGPPDEALAPQDLKNRQKNRANASQMAGSAANNPGESHMGIPNAGGGGFGIQDLLALFTKPGG